MKISFDCECILLQESLKLFLRDFTSHKKDCDFIIVDRPIKTQKPQFLISQNSGHLKIPFSKETLLSTLEEFYSATQISSEGFESERGSTFENDLDVLLRNVKRDLTNLIRSHS